jgi:dUTP pyrophosphatase
MIDQNIGKNVSYYLYPRSSISKTQFILQNNVGIIDAGYRGHIIAALLYIPTLKKWFDSKFFGDMYVIPNKAEYRDIDGNLYKKPGTNESSIKKNQRLVQICSPTLEPFDIEVLSDSQELSSSERGEGGFGSTGGH